MCSTFRLSLESPPAEANDTLPIKVPSASGGQVDASCNHAITLSCLQQLYNAVGYEPSAKHKNTIAVTSYLDQFASFSDLQKFYHLQRREAEGSNFTVVSINGLSCALFGEL